MFKYHVSYKGHVAIGEARDNYYPRYFSSKKLYRLITSCRIFTALCYNSIKMFIVSLHVNI